MQMKIIQLLPTIAYGDAVGNDTMALRDALLEFGYETHIYAENIDGRRTEDFIHHYTEMPQLEKDDVILYHFSTGSAAMANILQEAACRKVMIYHNITPGHFFEDYDPGTQALVDNGREELARLRGLFEACLCDSAYNMEDLRAIGYDCPMAVLPILIPFEDYDKAPSEKVISEFGKDGYTNFLFVGRVVPNKKHEDIIRAFAYYNKHYNEKSRLFLVGSPASGKYMQRLALYANRLGVADEVKFTGAVPFGDILAFYSIANIFLCMSEHEGFCVPLVEGMYFNIPVLAYGEAAVTETMGVGTGRIDDKSPAYAAACADYILKHTEEREKLLAAQKKCLEKFDNESIKETFKQLLELILKGDYSSFNVASAGQKPESFFDGLDLKGKGEDGGLLTLEAVPVPTEDFRPATGWKAGVKRKLIKPVYGAVSKCSPELAAWIKSHLYSLYYRLKDSKSVVLEPWNREKEGEKYLFVDTTQISRQDAKTGIQRVVNNIFMQMYGEADNIMAVKDFDGRLVTSYAYMHSAGLAKKRKEQLVTFGTEDKMLLLDSSWEYVAPMKRNIKLIHANKGQVGAVVYDLFPIQYPELFASKAFVNIFVVWHNMILQEADDILCISRTTADNVEKYFLKTGLKREKPLRLHYFPMGADIKVTNGEPRQELKDFVQEGKTFLMVGTIEPRKGHAVAIAAFEKLLQEGGDARLLIIGKDGWKNEGFVSLLENDRLKGRILWLKDAGDAELSWAYQHASALIAASKDEGYGLPLIEAAYYGIPIIASDIPIFHEVTGDKADFFKAMDSDSLCKSMKEWLSTDIHPDSKQIRLHTWQESAKVIMDIMDGKQEPYKVIS